MRKSLLWICIILSMLLVSISYAQPEPPNSYWGYVSENNILISDASITVHDASGNEIAKTISLASPNLGLYQVNVPWDDSATTEDEGVVSGETITIKVKGMKATSRVIDPRGFNTNIDLEVNTSGDSGRDSGRESGSGSSGSGSSGGGTSGENYDNIVVTETVRKEFLVKDSVESYQFGSTNNDILEIKFTSLTNSGTVVVNVEVLSDTSKLADNAAPDMVYKNINIWVGKAGWANSDNIKNPMIRFKVDRSWISENNIDMSTIRLNRYADGQWNQLVTTLTSEDETHLYFEAETPGFSPFAITGKKMTEELSSDIGNNVAATDQKTSVVGQTPIENKKAIPGFNVFSSVFILTMVLLLLIRNKK